MDLDLLVSGACAFVGAFLGMRTFVAPKLANLVKRVDALQGRCEVQHGRIP